MAAACLLAACWLVAGGETKSSSVIIPRTNQAQVNCAERGRNDGVPPPKSLQCMQGPRGKQEPPTGPFGWMDGGACLPVSSTKTWSKKECSGNVGVRVVVVVVVVIAIR